MQWFAWSAAIVAGQLFAGAALTLPGRARPPRRPAGPSRARLAGTIAGPGAVGLLGAAVVLAARSPAGVAGGTLAMAIVCGAPSAAGCLGLLAAGRLERLGRVRPARRLVRLAGRYAAAGAVATLALPPVTGLDGPLALGVGAAALTQGGAALLGALSRKPRPAGAVATAAWLVGAVLLARLTAG